MANTTLQLFLLFLTHSAYAFTCDLQENLPFTSEIEKHVKISQQLYFLIIWSTYSLAGDVQANINISEFIKLHWDKLLEKWLNVKHQNETEHRKEKLNSKENGLPLRQFVQKISLKCVQVHWFAVCLLKHCHHWLEVWRQKKHIKFMLERAKKFLFPNIHFCNGKINI